MDRPSGSFELGKYVVRVPYRVVVDSVNDGPQTVASAAGLPILYSTYSYGSESNSEMLARRYEPEPIGSSKTLLWRVNVVYETPSQKEGRGGPGGRDAGGGTGRVTPGEFLNPLLELPSVKFHSSGREALITRIYDNITGTFKPCTASNGEVFDPPPKFIETYGTLEISRNEPISSPQPGTALGYGNAVNSDYFWGIAPGYWRAKEIVPERQDRQLPSSPFKFAFLRVAYAFEYNPQGWDIPLLDYGSYYWARPENSSAAVPGNLPAVRRDIMTREGTKTSAPLNGNGMPLPDRVPYTPTAASDVINIAATTPPQRFSVGDIVQFSAIPLTGSPPSSVVAPAPLSFNRVYYVVENIVTAGAQALKVSATFGGAAITLTDTGTGWQYIYSPGVFFTIRPYNRLPYAALNLPQSFALVQ